VVVEGQPWRLPSPSEELDLFDNPLRIANSRAEADPAGRQVCSMDDETEVRVSALRLPQGQPEDLKDSLLLGPDLLALVDQDGDVVISPQSGMPRS
jgi:hypothetical protein